MSTKRCCVPGCADKDDSHKALHLFPNPDTDIDRFRIWVSYIRGDILALSNEYIYRLRRVCHVHFEEKYLCRFNRLSNIAVPTLHMPGPLSFPKFTYTERPIYKKEKDILNKNTEMEDEFAKIMLHDHNYYSLKDPKLLPKTKEQEELSMDSCTLRILDGSFKVVEYNLTEEDLVLPVLDDKNHQAKNPQNTPTETPDKQNQSEHNSSNHLSSSQHRNCLSTIHDENKQAKLDEMMEEISLEMNEPQYCIDIDYQDEAENTYEHSNVDEQHNFVQRNKESKNNKRKTPKKYMKKLLDVQNFGRNDWSETNCDEIQNSYICAPGFVELKTNEEVKPYDTLQYLSEADRSYAALTLCILKQQEAFEEYRINNIVSISQTTGLSRKALNGKFEEALQKTEYENISSDLLKLVCGYRTEIIETRREMVISQVKDPKVREILENIYPSTTHIFDRDLFTMTVVYSGGVSEVFWPPKANSNSFPEETTGRTMLWEDKTTIETQDIDQESDLPLNVITSYELPLQYEEQFVMLSTLGRVYGKLN